MCILYRLHKSKIGDLTGFREKACYGECGNVPALLKQLSSASQALSEASNKLTEQIKEIEAALASYNLGVVTWVELRRTPEDVEMEKGNNLQVTRIDRLGYSKKN